MKKTFLLICFISLVNTLQAQQVFTLNPGPQIGGWFSNSSWVGGISPGSTIEPGETVIIPAGSIVNYNQANLLILGTLQIDGTLGILNTGSSIQVFLGALNISGTLTYNQNSSSFDTSDDIINNAGTININGGSITQVLNFATERNISNVSGGELNITNGGNIASSFPFSNFNFFNDLFSTVNNEGAIGRTRNFENDGTINNTGSITITPSATSFNRPGEGFSTFQNSGTFTNSGTFNVVNGITSATATNTGSFNNDAGGNIVITAFAGTATFTNTANFSNNGSIMINSGSFQNSNSFSNTGNILARNGGLLRTTGGLTNEGVITNDATFEINGFGVLDNGSNGTIINNSGRTLLNNGTINSTGTFTNNGILINDDIPSTPTASGLINLGGANFTNNGSIINGNTIESTGTITNSTTGSIINNSFLINDGTILNQGNIEVLNDAFLGSVISSGSTIIENSGTFRVNNATLNLRRTAMTNTGSLILEGNTQAAAGRVFIQQASFSRLLNLPGGMIAINDFGELRVTFGSLLNQGGDINISTDGVLLVDGDFDNATNEAIFINDFGFVQNEGLISVSDNGTIENFSQSPSPGNTASILNNGNINIESRARLINRGDILNTTSGMISMSGDQLANIPNSGFSFLNDGTINIQRANAINSPTPFINSGDGLFTNNGTLNLIDGNGINTGALSNTATGVITINSQFQNGALNESTKLSNEGLIINTNSFENIFEAVFENNGDFMGSGAFSNSETSHISGINSSHTSPVINNGIISPGNANNAIGIYNFNTDFTDQNSADLNIEIAAASTPGVGYDQVAISGTAQLAGNLTVVFSLGYTPQLGDTFTILTATTVTGTFENTSFPIIDQIGGRLEITYNTDNVILEVVPSLDVVSTMPIHNTINIPVDTNININFNDAINSNILTNNSVVISGNQGTITNLSASSVNGSMVSFDSTIDFFPGEIITTSLTPNVESTSATNLTPTLLQFTTSVNTNSPGSFPLSANNVTTTADGASNVFAADIDGDRNLDLIVSSDFDGRVTWFKNNADGTFTPQTDIVDLSDTTNPTDTLVIFISDLDNDGDMDVLAASQNNLSLSWFENMDGLGNFAPQQSLTLDVNSVSSIYTADLDHDGDQDVITSSFFEDRITLFKNNGNGTFQEQGSIASGAEVQGASSVYTADIDNDGDIDILSSSFTNNTIAFYLNNGDATFQSQQVITDTAMGAEKVRVADINNDGNLDVLSASSLDNSIAWHPNNGNGTFGNQQIISNSVNGASDLYTGDLDGDGNLDVIATSRNDNSISWFRNNGNDTFNSSEIITNTVLGAESIFAADLNNDGDLEVLTASKNDDSVVWFENIQPFLVTAISPLQNDIGIAASQDIALTFNDENALDANTVSTSSVQIHGASGPSINFSTPTITGATTTFNTDRNFFPGELVTTIATTLIQDITGRNLEAPFVSQYTTGVAQNGPANFINGQNVISSTSTGAQDIYAADIDGDNDLDVIVASTDNNRIAWYANNGNGTFGSLQIIAEGISVEGASSIFAADIDNDGDMDIIAASQSNNRISWFENTNAQGIFGTQQIITDLVNFPESIYAADLNGDSNIDIISASSLDNRIAWYQNNGDGTFGIQQNLNTTAAGASSVFATDFNNDGHLDVLFASRGGSSVGWHPNNGDGTFGASQTIANLTIGVESVYAADLNNDGYMDSLSASTIENDITLNFNNGDGTFGESQTIEDSAGGTSDVFAADLDGDNDLDIITASFSADTISWFENNGDGTFGDLQTITNSADGVTSIFTADLDGDGDLDVLSTSQEDNTIAWYLNSPPLPLSVSTISPSQNEVGSTVSEDILVTFATNSALDETTVNSNTVFISGSNGLGLDFPTPTNSGNTFTINPNRDYYPGEIITTTLTTNIENSIGSTLAQPFTSQFIATVNPESAGTFPNGLNTITNSADAAQNVYAADLNNDGNIDILSASEFDDRIAWYKNNGDGTFSGILSITTSANGAQSVYAADLDGDGYMDVLSASNLDDRIAWYRNNGDETFSGIINITTSANNANDVHAADLDGDGDMDVLSASIDDDRIAWYRNNGNGTFSGVLNITTSANGAESVYTADLDNDGDLDVLSASAFDDRIAWYSNNGDGTFGNPQNITTSANGAADVYATDLDNDGDMDVISASRFDDRIAWYENNGDSTFGFLQVINASADNATSVHASDLDGDGFMDILSSSNNDDRIAWYRNNGDGSFGGTQNIAFLASARSVYTADLDGDGDLDVITASTQDDRIAWFENDEIPEPFLVETTNPTQNEVDVDNDQDITITLNDQEPINSTTITSSTLNVFGNNASINFPSPTLVDATISINPNRNYFPGEVITTITTTSIQDATGQNLEAPFVSQFTARASTNSPGEFPNGQNIITTANGANETYAADLDNDGDIDVISISGIDDFIIWHPNNGDGTFQAQRTVAQGSQINGLTGIYAADIDRDGDLDILSSSFAADRIAWYANDGLGNFGAQQIITNLADNAQDVFAADLDGDGDLDVLSASLDDDRIAWYENNGTGGFGPMLTISTQINGARSVFAVDLDNDGDIDVLSAAAFDDSLFWHENNGDSTFSAQQIISNLPDNVQEIYAADLDGDSYMDVLSASSSDDRIAWYKNNGDKTFSGIQNITTNADGANGVYTGDMDGDGHLDVLSSSILDDTIAWYRNNGTGDFIVQPIISNMADGAVNVFAADLDNDGDLDVLSASLIDDRIAWYENAVNTLCPGGLTTWTDIGGGVLGWDNGVPDATMTVIIAEDYNTSTMSLGDITACELIVNTNAILTITDGHFINIENNITVNGTLYVANAGSVIQIDPTATTINNGTITVNKTTPSLEARDFIVLSSPMTAETNGGVLGGSNRVFSIIPENFIPNTDPLLGGVVANFIDDNGDYIDNLERDDLNLTGDATGLDNILNPSQGYIVFPQAPNATGATIFDHTHTQGIFNNGDIIAPIHYNGPATANNFNLLGNPYPSAIDTEMLIANNTAINEVYFWEHITAPNENLPGFGSQNFSMDDVSVRNAMMGIAAVNGGTVPEQYMASGQGFGILADQAAAGTDVTFTNAMRVTGNNNTPRSSEQENRLWIRLDSETYTSQSTTGIGFVPEATPAFDPGYDSNRLATTISLFSTSEEGEQLSIQGREVFDPTMQINLGFQSLIPESENYTISIGQLEGAALSQSDILLIDNLTGITTNLQETSYSFTASETLQEDRFTLVFQEREVLSTQENSLENNLSLYPNPAQGQIQLSYAGSQALNNLVITDILGKRVQEISLNEFNGTQTIDVSRLQTGLYLFFVTSEQNTTTMRVIIK